MHVFCINENLYQNLKKIKLLEQQNENYVKKIFFAKKKATNHLNKKNNHKKN